MSLVKNLFNKLTLIGIDLILTKIKEVRVLLNYTRIGFWLRLEPSQAHKIVVKLDPENLPA